MFYIVERSDQLPPFSFGDCFIRFISKNDNFHPALTDLSLVYIRPLEDKKGYILCINHSESLGIKKQEVLEWLSVNTDKLWVINKKEAMHFAPQLSEKLFDVHLLDFVDLTEALGNRCISYYYNNLTHLPNVNCLIPISKHYEECEAIFGAVLSTIKKYTLSNAQFQFQNFRTTNVFYQIEKNGINVDKNCFIDFYGDKLKYPQFNLFKGKIYTQYNLYTTTSRPSNTFNGTNYAALNKDNGERACYRPSNDRFIEMDFQGYHPRLIGEIVGFDFPKDRNTYEYLGEILGVSQQEAKELTFKQLYGGVWAEYVDKPFFKQVNMFIDDMWDMYQYGKLYSTSNKIFICGDEDITRNKLFNYIIQSTETSTNVELLELVLDYLKDKKTKLVLYTYDAFLFDYSKEDGQILQDIVNKLEYPVSIKQGKTYHGLEKI